MRGSSGRWGLDSEFLNGKLGGETTCISVSSGDESNTYVFWEPHEFAGFLRAHPQLKTFFVFNLAPEYGSLENWGFDVSFDHTADKVSQAWLRFEGRSILLFDTLPFWRTMKKEYKDLKGLAGVSKFLSKYFNEDLEKYEKPAYLGQRHPTGNERGAFGRYAKQDARATSFGARYLLDELIFSQMKPRGLVSLRSFGTVAAWFFKIPRIGVKVGKTEVVFPSLHMALRDEHAIFAGRSEAFITGSYAKHNFYNDRKKQYAGATSATGALMLGRDCYRIMGRSEISKINSLEDIRPYGWVRGRFVTTNDKWGVPVRSKERNYYVIGEVEGLWHTFDLIAAKAKILRLDSVYVATPDLKLKPLHDRFVSIYSKVQEGQVANEVELSFYKGVINALTGRLSLKRPHESPYTNYPAYNTIVAYAHLEMSRIFDAVQARGAEILYMDTDSVFSNVNLSGSYATIKDATGEYEFPVIMDVKGESDSLRIARSKLYYQSDDQAGWSAWHPDLRDFWKIIRELPTSVQVSLPIKKTFRTKQYKTKGMVMGRWYDEPIDYDYEKLCSLFRADNKRIRDEYNSYELFRKNACVYSRAPTVREFGVIRDQDDVWISTSGKRYSSMYMRDFIEKYKWDERDHKRMGL